MSARSTRSSASIRWRPIRPQSVETILQGLPGSQPVLSDGTKLKSNNSHPLKHFVFDPHRPHLRQHRRADRRLRHERERDEAVRGGRGRRAARAVWMFTPPAGGIFPALQAGRGKSAARGLRARPAQLDGARRASALSRRGLCVAAGRERARPARTPTKPNEEMNALERGKHYGWPYCYDLATVEPANTRRS